MFFCLQYRNICTFCALLFGFFISHDGRTSTVSCTSVVSMHCLDRHRPSYDHR